MNEQTKDPTQTAVYSEYVGSLKDATAEKGNVPRRKDPNAWRRFQYPNRKVRRKYDVKGKKKYALTPTEIQNGKTWLDKIGEVLRDNIDHGNMLHRAFQNEVATDHMHFERAKGESCLKSLTDALGPDAGVKAYNSNRKRQSIYADKKTTM